MLAILLAIIDLALSVARLLLDILVLMFWILVVIIWILAWLPLAVLRLFGVILAFASRAPHQLFVRATERSLDYLNREK